MLKVDFDSSIHMSCPVCDFEAIYCDSQRNKVYYLFKDGTIDPATADRDNVAPEDHGLQCNSIHCTWKQN